MRTAARVPVVVLILLALVAGCTAGVEGAKPQFVDVGAAGGTVGSEDGPARITVPPGAAPDGTSVRIAVAESAPPPTSDAVATALGVPADISPSIPIEGAEVRLPFDPESELPEADGNRATVDNAYIAVYSPAIAAWVPLPTRFENGELVAAAPHFSRFGKFVVDPGKAAWSATKTGVQAAWDTGGDLLGAAWDTGGDLLSAAGSAGKEFLNPDKDEIDEFCEPDTDGWDLENPVTEVDGCVQVTPEGDLLFWVENGLRLMYDVRPPPRTDIGLTEHDGYKALVPFLSRRMNLPLGLALAPARGFVQMRVPADVARRISPVGSSFTVSMEPEQLGLAVQAVLAALAWLPARKYVEQAVVRLSERGAFTALTERGLTRVEYLRETMVLVTRELSVAAPSALTTAGSINDAMNCVFGTYEEGVPSVSSIREAVADALAVAKRCASTAVERLGTTLKQNVKEVLAVVAAFPDTLEALEAVADGVKVSAPFVGQFGGQFDLRFIRTADAPPGPAPAPVELTPDRLASLGVCAVPCRITGQVSFDHPTWGPSTLVTTLSVEPRAEADIAVVDAAGLLRWDHDASDWFALAPADPARDATGHIFLNYNPGRYNGVIVLNPIVDGFGDFDTLPAPGDFWQRFYSARLTDDDGDGTYEILSEINSCDPACADANYVRQSYRWNRTDYVPA